MSHDAVSTVKRFVYVLINYVQTNIKQQQDLAGFSSGDPSRAQVPLILWNKYAGAPQTETY